MNAITRAAKKLPSALPRRLHLLVSSVEVLFYRHPSPRSRLEIHGRDSHLSHRPGFTECYVEGDSAAGEPCFTLWFEAASMSRPDPLRFHVSILTVNVQCMGIAAYSLEGGHSDPPAALRSLFEALRAFPVGWSRLADHFLLEFEAENGGPPAGLAEDRPGTSHVK